MISQVIGYLILGYFFGYIFNQPIHYRVAFILFASLSIFTIYYLYKYLPPMGREERIEPGGITFRIDKGFRVILLVEALTTIAWSIAPTIVFLNYIVNVLGGTLFEAVLAEVSVSLGSILATYIVERIDKSRASQVMLTGYLLITMWSLIMFLKPPIHIVIPAYFIMELGSTMIFPYYRSWLFRKIPKDKATTLFSALSSYRRMIRTITPFIAGLLATIDPTLPYGVSLALFLTTGIILFRMYGL